MTLVEVILELLEGWEQLSWWTVTLAGATLLALLHIPSVLLQRHDRPSAALAWILCMLELPFLGVIAWWVLGRTHLARRRRRRVQLRTEMETALTTLLEANRRASDRARGDGAEPLDADGLPGTEAALPGLEEASLPDVALENVHGDPLPSRAFLLDDRDGVFPATGGNLIKMYIGGQQAYPGLEEAIAQATDHIHLEFYIWENDDVGRWLRDLLIEKAREGVEVRVLFDAIGGYWAHGRFMRPLEEAGGKVASFLPLRFLERRLRINFRNHRKIVVIDGAVGFTGGINVGDEYNEWMDLFFRLRGPAVFQLQEIFTEDWYFATKEELADIRYFPGADGHLPTPMCDHLVLDLEPQPEELHASTRVVASGPDLERRTVQHMFFLAITAARHRIFIATPYFIPDQAIMVALQTAALRGVDVRLLVPGRSDVWVARLAGRAFYEDLLRAGVEIFEYDQSQVLHAKMLLIDQEWSFIGSANMDIRSFRLNFEVNSVLFGHQITAQLADWFLDCLERSTRIDLEPFARRPARPKYLEALARLGSPLL